MGDGRTYDETIAIRAVDTDDFMTAAPSPLGISILSSRISRYGNLHRTISKQDTKHLLTPFIIAYQF